MSTTETAPPPVNQQGLDIRPTPREEMNLYPLDTFPYEYVGREIRINFEIPEFTAICPFSDFPDFAIIRLDYVPNERCIELKSLKLYVNSFREVKIFHEHVINIILEDFVARLRPPRASRSRATSTSAATSRRRPRELQESSRAVSGQWAVRSR